MSTNKFTITIPPQNQRWHKPPMTHFKEITEGDQEIVSFLDKEWIVTMDEMIVTGVKGKLRTLEGLYVLTAPDGEQIRMTTSAYLHAFEDSR
jgi:hypothetical protein